MTDRPHPQPTGRLNEPSAVRALQFDDVVATYVVDGVLALQAAEFFPAVPTEYWSSDHGLFDSGSRMVMSAGGLLIERDGGTLLIDAGLGPTTEDSVVGPINSGSMLDVLGSLGRRPRGHRRPGLHAPPLRPHGLGFHPWRRRCPDEDVSECPLHGVDAGMGAVCTRRGRHGLRDVPGAHPEARGKSHRVRRRRRDLSRRAGGRDARAQCRPHVVCDHLGTNGARLVAFGDAFHIPAQMAHPEWPSAPDIDVQSVKKARRRLLDELTQPNTFGFAFHFGDQPFGRVTTNGGKPAWEPIPTTVRAPAPRTFP